MHIELTPPSGKETPPLQVVWDEHVPGGSGLEFRHAWFSTQFGDAFALCSEKGVAGLGFANERSREKAQSHFVKELWPEARWTEDEDAVALAMGESGPSQIHLRGTPFQHRVWDALLACPSGETCSYADLARAVGGKSGTSRAVGGALSANPVSWFVPCHRVVGSDGEMTGYLWGIPVKQSMILWESKARESKISSE